MNTDKHILRELLKQRQTDSNIDPVLLARYVDGQCSTQEKDAVELLLAQSEQARVELSAVRIAINNDAQEKESRHKSFWFKPILAASVFAIVSSFLLVSWWYQSPDLSGLGINKATYQQLPEDIQSTIQSVQQQNWPQPNVFTGLKASNQVLRNQQVPIQVEFPLWSRLDKLERLAWRYSEPEKNTFSVIILNNQDRLIHEFSADDIDYQNGTYSIDLTTQSLDLCYSCQYGWRILHDSKPEASELMAFEYAPLNTQQKDEITSLPEGIARLSYFWNHGYLHAALAELDHVEANEQTNALIEKIKQALNDQLNNRLN